MSELGFSDAGFAHSLAANLYMGNIMWNTWTTPRNISPFIIFELDPLSSTQMAHCLYLHLLSKNTEGKSLDKIKASQIQEIKAPRDFCRVTPSSSISYGHHHNFIWSSQRACHWNKILYRCHPIRENSLQNVHSCQRQVSHEVPVCQGNTHPTLARQVSKTFQPLDG
jgi:hypothetical protein